MNVKLTREDDFNEVWLYPKYGGEGVEGFPIDFKIMVSLDGEEWTEAVSKTGYPGSCLYSRNSTTGNL